MSDSYELRGVYFQQEVVTDVVKSLNIPVGLTQVRVVLSVHANGLRVRWDGGDPTPTLGHQLMMAASPGAGSDASRLFELQGSDRIYSFRYVRDGSADSEIAWTVEAV